jgi:hypothetical protein
MTKLVTSMSSCGWGESTCAPPGTPAAAPPPGACCGREGAHEPDSICCRASSTRTCSSSEAMYLQQVTNNRTSEWVNLGTSVIS